MAVHYIQTLTYTIAINRMGSVNVVFPATVGGEVGDLDLTGFTARLWVATPVLGEPTLLTFIEYEPTVALVCDASGVTMKLAESDFVALGLRQGSFPFEILVSDDAGLTTDKPALGMLQVNSFLTTQFE